MNWYDVLLNETNMNVPDSCCTFIVDEIVDFPDRCQGKYQEGCISRLSIIVHRSALYIGTGALAIALIQVSKIQFFSLNFNHIFCMLNCEPTIYHVKHLLDR